MGNDPRCERERPALAPMREERLVVGLADLVDLDSPDADRTSRREARTAMARRRVYFRDRDQRHAGIRVVPRHGCSTGERDAARRLVDERALATRSELDVEEVRRRDMHRTVA